MVGAASSSPREVHGLGPASSMAERMVPAVTHVDIHMDIVYMCVYTCVYEHRQPHRFTQTHRAQT